MIIMDILITLSIYSYHAVIRRIVRILPVDIAYLCAISRYLPYKHPNKYMIITKNEFIICYNGIYNLYFNHIYNELSIIYNQYDDIIIEIRHNKIVSYIDINRKLIITRYNNGNIRAIIYKLPDGKHKLCEYSRDNSALICDNICHLYINKYDDNIHIECNNYGRKIRYDANGRVIEINHKYQDRIKGSHWIFDKKK